MAVMVSTLNMRIDYYQHVIIVSREYKYRGLLYCPSHAYIFPIHIQEVGLGYFPALPLVCILSQA